MSIISEEIEDGLKITGFGFVNKNIEILCIKSISNKKILYLTPLKKADPREVIISWDENIDSIKPLLEAAPFLDMNSIDLGSLEPIAVSLNSEKTAIWIG